MSPEDGWRDIWERRSLDEGRGSLLSKLMAADGLDTAFGAVSEQAWVEFAQRTSRELRVPDGGSVFEVGCGAGALLLPLKERGLRVGGLDRSATLIAMARAAIPDGSFEVAEAVDTSRLPHSDLVISCGVFLYFPDLDYASRVVDAMVARAGHAVAILDIPDAALQSEALACRVAMVGGEERYRQLYDGLEHLYYKRSWVEDRLRRAGLKAVRTFDQNISGYVNGRFRFNAYGFKHI